MIVNNRILLRLDNESGVPHGCKMHAIISIGWRMKVCGGVGLQQAGLKRQNGRACYNDD